MLTQEYIKELFYYEPFTGTCVWIKDHLLMKKGQVAGNMVMKDDYIKVMIDHIFYRVDKIVWCYMTGVWPEEIYHSLDRRMNNIYSYLSDKPFGSVPKVPNKAISVFKKQDGGIYFNINKKTYTVNIRIDGKQNYLGSHSSLKLAREARVAFFEKENIIFEKEPSLRFKDHFQD